MSCTTQAFALAEDERPDVSHVVTEDDTPVDNSLVLWKGTFEDVYGVWLRWADLEGNVIPRGAERAQTWQNALRTRKLGLRDWPKNSARGASIQTEMAEPIFLLAYG